MYPFYATQHRMLLFLQNTGLLSVYILLIYFVIYSSTAQREKVIKQRYEQTDKSVGTGRWIEAGADEGERISKSDRADRAVGSVDQPHLAMLLERSAWQ